MSNSYSENEVQRALQDLAHIRRAIEGVQGSKTAPASSQGLSTAFLLQLGAFLASTALLLIEWLSGGENTSLILASRHSEALRTVGLIDVGVALLLLGFCLRLIVRAGARQNNEVLSDYIARNFVYLRNFSFASDLGLKFIIFALVILARVPELASPLLLVFTADYLFQGRLFVLPFRVAMLLGLVLLGVALLQFSTGNPSIIPALSCFSLVSAFAVLRALVLNRGCA